MTSRPFALRLIVLIGTVVAFAACANGAFARSSSSVAVVPGFGPPVYPGYEGVPGFPVSAPELAAYTFTPVGSSDLTSAKLRGFDTVVLYGLQWRTLSSSAQSAVNAFAKTGKVIIWDADSTGSQQYSSFVHPFSTRASGEHRPQAGAVVTYPAGDNPLASSEPSSPRYLNPTALVAVTHLIGDMSVMIPGAAEWAPALIAHNPSIPDGGWALAWAYGDTASHTGMVVYSGLDADAFTDANKPNYALKELRIELAAPFSTTLDAGCAPNCVPPAGSGSGGGGESGGSSGGGSASGTYAQCSLVRPAPTTWVHGTVRLLVRTSVASGLQVRTLTAGGRQLALGQRTARVGQYALGVNTNRLPSNRQARVFVVVDVGGKRACSLTVRLKVDNRPPRIFGPGARRVVAGVEVAFRVSESSTVVVAAGSRVRRLRVVQGKTARIRFPTAGSPIRITARDRAGNTSTRRFRPR